MNLSENHLTLIGAGRDNKILIEATLQFFSWH